MADRGSRQWCKRGQIRTSFTLRIKAGAGDLRPMLGHGRALCLTAPHDENLACIMAQSPPPSGRPKRLPNWSALSLLVVGVVVATVGIWIASYRFFVSEEIDQAQARLSLYRSTVLAEVERFEHLTQVLSVDPFVIAGLEEGANDPLNARLMDFAHAAGLDAIFLMDVDGLTTAASNAGTEGTFVGQTYSFRPYFQAALGGDRGRFYGIGATTG